MSSFAQMSSDLQLLGMANLNTTDVGSLLNKVNREEVENHDWSFLYTNLVIWSQQPVSGTTMALTQGSNIVSDPHASFTSNQTGWFLSVGATLTLPVIVAAVIDAQTLMLTTTWLGASIASTGYSLYPRYYSVSPLIEVTRVMQEDFLVETSQEALNRIDPARVSTGGDPALRWAPGPFTNDSPQQYQIELWPRPSTFLPYIVDGKLGPQDMLNPNDQPQVPSAVIENKALMYLALGVFASNGNAKWFQIAQHYEKTYKDELEKAIAADNRRKITLGSASDGEGLLVNSGLDYVATHDASGPPYIGSNP